MQRLAIFMAVLATAAISSSAAEARVCGPGTAKTLSDSAQARVYISNGSVRACHVKRRGSYAIGTKVIDVQVVGRYANVRGRTSEGQSLRVFDLRRARPESKLQRFRRVRMTKLDASGVAVSHAVALDGRGVVTASDHGVFARVDAVDDVGMRGAILAYRTGRAVVLRNYHETFSETVRKATDGELLRVGDVRLSAKGATVVARGGAGKRVRLGTPGVFSCDARSTCSGWGTVQIIGDRVVRPAADVGSNAWVDVIDLAAGTTTTLCPGNVARHQVSASGKVACAQYGLQTQILVEGVVVDAGMGIAPESLQIRGAQFVWLNGGVERTAPIPR